MVKFKYFSRPLNVFQVLFMANFIFKDFSRQSCIFKYFSSLCEPCLPTELSVLFVKIKKTNMEESISLRLNDNLCDFFY